MFKIKIFILLFIPLNYLSQDLTCEEKKLYNLIMEYRKDNKLKKIPISSSLTLVAQIHLKDLIHNKPDLKKGNAHSWSNKGNWSSVNYLGYQHQARYIWDKPRELTSYKGDGFEIVCGSNKCCSDFVMTAEYALDSWIKSTNHNNMIINKKNFKKIEWKSIGIAVKNGFAVVWFGKEKDKSNGANIWIP